MSKSSGSAARKPWRARTSPRRPPRPRSLDQPRANLSARGRVGDGREGELSLEGVAAALGSRASLEVRRSPGGRCGASGRAARGATRTAQSRRRPGPGRRASSRPRAAPRSVLSALVVGEGPESARGTRQRSSSLAPGSRRWAMRRSSASLSSPPSRTLSHCVQRGPIHRGARRRPPRASRPGAGEATERLRVG